MKILVVSTLYYPYEIGGAERSTRLIVQGYVNRGYDVEVLTTCDRNYVDEIDGVKVHYVQFKHIFWRYKSKSQHFLKKVLWRFLEVFNPFNNKKIRDKLQEIQPDVIHTNNIAGIGYQIWNQAKKLDIKVIHTARNFYLICAKSSFFKKNKACDKQCLSCKLYTCNYKKQTAKIDAFVGVSNFVKQVHLDHGYFKNASTAVSINNIFNGEFTDKANVLSASKNNQVTFGVLGFIRETKGVVELLTNLKYNDSFRIQIAGANAGDKYAAKFLNTIKNKPIDYLGHIDPSIFFKNIDFLIHPSISHDAFPRVLIESFSYGIPVISSNNGGTKEAIIGMNTGFVYKDYDQLNSIINNIVNDKYDYEKMSQNCLKYAQETFSEESIISKYSDVIEQLE